MVEFSDNSSISIGFTSGEVAGQKITIKKLSNVSNETVLNQQFSKTVGIYDISFAVPDFSADLIFGYDDASLLSSGINEDDLGVAFFDSVDSRGFIWHNVTVNLDKNNNTISVSTSHFSIWALVDKNDALITSVDEEKTTIPTRFELMQNYPNPFNPETNIRFNLVSTQKVSLKIYNIMGNLVKTLISSQFSAGEHMAVWDGRNDSGFYVSTGIYFYMLEAGAFTKIKKMMLIK